MEASVMGWPSRLLDLHPIKNLEFVIGKEIYKQGKVFDITNDLKEALMIEFVNIIWTVGKNLVNSMSERLLAVIDSKSAPTLY